MKNNTFEALVQWKDQKLTLTTAFQMWGAADLLPTFRFKSLLMYVYVL